MENLKNKYRCDCDQSYYLTQYGSAVSAGMRKKEGYYCICCKCGKYASIYKAIGLELTSTTKLNSLWSDLDCRYYTSNQYGFTPKKEGSSNGEIRKEIDYSKTPLNDILYNEANKLVGKIGESTQKAVSVTGESYIQYVNVVGSSRLAILDWIDWIKVYIETAASTFTGKCDDLGHDLTIYWRMKPEISEYKTGKKISDEELKEGIFNGMVYARLLISNRKGVVKFKERNDKWILSK